MWVWVWPCENSQTVHAHNATWGSESPGHTEGCELGQRGPKEVSSAEWLWTSHLAPPAPLASPSARPGSAGVCQGQPGSAGVSRQLRCTAVWGPVRRCTVWVTGGRGCLIRPGESPSLTWLGRGPFPARSPRSAPLDLRLPLETYLAEPQSVSFVRTGTCPCSTAPGPSSVPGTPRTLGGRLLTGGRTGRPSGTVTLGGKSEFHLRSLPQLKVL